MPRPARPLQNLVTGRPQNSDHHTLTPRTPHSQAGRVGEALDEVELDQLGAEIHNTYRQQQSQPLLASSVDGFPPSGYRSQGDDQSSWTRRKLFPSLEIIVERIPLALGIVVVCVLLMMIMVSLKRPEFLQYYIGDSSSTDSKFTPSEDDSVAVPPSHHQNDSFISYENYTNFPLLPADYRHECNKLPMYDGDYWQVGPGAQDVPHRDDVNYQMFEGEKTSVCNSSITYMLDGYVGLLADLALMAQVAALARMQNRTFLIDDTYWNRGKWTDHFQDVRSRQPGPEPGCRAPPPEELVACPRTARHWVINSRTAKFHFGHGFSNAFEDPYSRQLNRLEPIFSFAAQSFADTIRPNAQNAALIHAARSEFASTVSSSPYVAVHLRRGDRSPKSWKYHGKHIPIANYAEAVHDTWIRLSSNQPSDHDQYPVYIASDSPTAQATLVASLPRNFTPFYLAQSSKSELRALASPKEYLQHEFNHLSEEERVVATRGMIVDFSLLSGMWSWQGETTPAATICTISSNVCKLSAVGLGWEQAFGILLDDGVIDEKGKRWVEIDTRGGIVPVWQAFEIFM